MTADRTFVFILLFNCCYLMAGEVLVLHDNIGAEIDIIEKVHYLKEMSSTQALSRR